MRRTIPLLLSALLCSCGGSAPAPAEKVKVQEAQVRKAAPPPPAVPRMKAQDFQKLRGTWQARQVGGSIEWVFSFGEDYYVSVRPSGDTWYEGQATLRSDLGADADGMVRVPPGSNQLDVEVSGASMSSFIGAVSLGSVYSVSATELNLCVSRPGVHKRVPTYDISSEQVRCFKLTRTSNEPLPLMRPPPVTGLATAAPSPAPVSSAPLTAPKTWDQNGDPNLSGEASLALDGAEERYELRSNSISYTDLKDPRRATLHFQPRTADDNTSGLLLTLDTTHVGRHWSEGDSAQIGADTANGRSAALKLVGNGGRVWFPKPACAIEVTAAYTGEANGTLSGTVTGCTLHSAGIDHSLSSVQFTVRGSPTKQ